MDAPQTIKALKQFQKLTLQKAAFDILFFLLLFYGPVLLVLILAFLILRLGVDTSNIGVIVLATILLLPIQIIRKKVGAKIENKITEIVASGTSNRLRQTPTEKLN